jgi:protein TonB
MAMSLCLSRPTQDSQRRAPRLVAWPVSVGVHVFVLAAALVIPLMAADVLPAPQDVIVLIQAVPVPEPPPAPLPLRAAAAMAQAVADRRLAPVSAPLTVGQETGIAIPPDVGLSDLVHASGTVPGGIEGGVGGWFDRAPVPPPVTAPVRPGGTIRPPEKIVDIKPVYPELALRARVQGVVIIEAVIGTNGAVEEAKLLRSMPLLDQAALDAVRQWRYTPTLLDGVPVTVIITVTVQFTLK